MIKFSVLDLIEQLNGIVNSNPEIDFSDVEVSLNNEYSWNYVRLEDYNSAGDKILCVDLF